MVGLFPARPALNSRCMSRLRGRMLVRAGMGVNQRDCVMKERTAQDKETQAFLKRELFGDFQRGREGRRT